MDALTAAPAIASLDSMSTPNNHSTAITTIASAVVAIVLVGGIIILTMINPYALIGLAPVLLAVAAIVRAVTCARRDTTK